MKGTNSGASANPAVLSPESAGTAADIIPIETALRVKHPLKICILGYRSAPFGGGQGIYIKYLSKALVEAGHQVDVISGQPYPHVDPRVNLIKLPGLNLFETGLGSLRPHHLRSWTNVIEWTSKLTGGFAEPLCFSRRAVKHLREHGRHYDIIHDNQCLGWGMLKLQQEDFPLVTTIHHPVTSDLDIALAAANKWWERILIRRWHSFIGMQKKVARRLKHVVTVSERSRGDIAKAFQMPADNIHLVHCGIDISDFRPMPEVPKIPRRLMATVSADHPLKGATYLIRAMHQLRQKYPDISLLMVCKPKPDGEAMALIKRLGLQDSISFVSGISTEQLACHYNSAEVAVVPSVYEGFGLPAGEAMACATALVSTEGGALPEVVGDAGISVPVKDSEALAAAIDKLLANAELRAEMGERGRQRIEELFCWQRCAEQMTDYYWQVIDQDLHPANSESSNTSNNNNERNSDGSTTAVTA